MTPSDPSDELKFIRHGGLSLISFDCKFRGR